MNVKTILYLVTVPLIIWSLESLNIEKFFKKDRNYQVILFYLIFSISLSYLVVNFFYDFFLNSKFI